MKIQRTISEFITDRSLAAVSEDAAIGEAVAAMRDGDSDCVLVVDRARRPVGIFTERDFLNRVAARGKGIDTPVSEVMTADPETLGPDDAITYAINRMAVGGYRNVPIVDGEGRAVANLSVRDVILHLDDVFAELDDAEDDEVSSEWDDIGGGG